MQPSGSKRRKVSIEVYFVLYLSAIVLLMGTPTTPSKHEDPDEVIRALREFMIDFHVDVEKVALAYTMLPPGLDVYPISSQLRRDSVNVVKAWGSVENVSFEIAGIRDTSTGQMLPTESVTLQNAGPTQASVHWRPKGPLQNRVYAITIAASADPVVPAAVPASSRDRVEAALRSEGRVRDTVTFTVSVFAVSDSSMVHAVVEKQRGIPDTSTLGFLGRSPYPGAAPSYSVGPFDAVPGQQPVMVSAGQRWTNRIVFSGITNVDTELDPPTFEPSSIRKSGSSGGVIELSGPAFASPEQTVTVTARRRSDGRIASTTFVVKTGKLSSPSVPTDLFVGETYTINFGADDVDASQITIRVKENGKLVLNDEPALLTYRPRSAGSATFERYVSGRLESHYDAAITPLPLPIVIAIRKESSDRGVITTKSYGTFAGKANMAVLTIPDGNTSDIQPKEIDYKYDKPSRAHVQTWLVRRRHADQDFAVTAWTWDQRGSAVRTERRIAFD